MFADFDAGFVEQFGTLGKCDSNRFVAGGKFEIACSRIDLFDNSGQALVSVSFLQGSDDEDH